MPFERGEIVDYEFEIPHNGKFIRHPALIISNEHVYNTDSCYICVMLTSSETIDDMFTFRITPDMLVKPPNKEISQARLHIVTYVLEKNIFTRLPHNKMKAFHVDRLVEHITQITLSSLD